MPRLTIVQPDGSFDTVITSASSVPVPLVLRNIPARSRIVLFNSSGHAQLRSYPSIDIFGSDLHVDQIFNWLRSAISGGSGFDPQFIDTMEYYASVGARVAIFVDYAPGDYSAPVESDEGASATPTSGNSAGYAVYESTGTGIATYRGPNASYDPGEYDIIIVLDAEGGLLNSIGDGGFVSGEFLCRKLFLGR